jgi:hypothetical protein
VNAFIALEILLQMEGEQARLYDCDQLEIAVAEHDAVVGRADWLPGAVGSRAGVARIGRQREAQPTVHGGQIFQAVRGYTDMIEFTTSGRHLCPPKLNV